MYWGIFFISFDSFLFQDDSHVRSLTNMPSPGIDVPSSSKPPHPVMVVPNSQMVPTRSPSPLPHLQVPQPPPAHMGIQTTQGTSSAQGSLQSVAGFANLPTVQQSSSPVTIHPPARTLAMTTYVPPAQPTQANKTGYSMQLPSSSVAALLQGRVK